MKLNVDPNDSMSEWRSFLFRSKYIKPQKNTKRTLDTMYTMYYKQKQRQMDICKTTELSWRDK